jgi:hypothetical protein
MGEYVKIELGGSAASVDMGGLMYAVSQAGSAKPLSRAACVEGTPSGPPLQHAYRRPYLLAFFAGLHRLERLSKPDNCGGRRCLYQVRTISLPMVSGFFLEEYGVSEAPTGRNFAGAKNIFDGRPARRALLR